MKTFFKSESGTSLIEMLTAMSLFMILISFIYIFYLTGIENWKRNTHAAEARSEAALAIKQIAKDIREAEYISQTDPLIGTADRNEIVLYSDVNNDSKPEKIRIYLDGNFLRRAVYSTVNQSAPWLFSNIPNEHILSGNIRNSSTNPAFRYHSSYTQEFTQLPIAQDSLSNIRLVGVKLLVDSNTKFAPLPIELETEIYLRNFE